MRINTTNLSGTKTLNARKIPKSIYASANKNYKREYNDNFTKLGAWINLKSGWTFGSGQATTTQPSTNYTLSVSDVNARNIDAQINLNQSGAGIAFWVESPNTWWAAIPYYTTNSEQYISSYYYCNCQQCCWGYNFNSRLNDDTDNLTGMRIVTNGPSVTVYAKDNAGNFLETTNSFTASSLPVGILSGIMFAPGGYAETAVITSFSSKAVE